MIIFNSIKGKTIAALTVFTLVFIGIFVSTLIITTSQKSDSLLINISGRERMLSQKIVKETLSYVALPQSNIIKKETIQKSMALFEKSLYALADGGETFSDLDMKKSVLLPSPQTEEIKAHFSRLKDPWDACKKTLSGLIGSRTINQGDIEKLLDQCSEYLRNLDEAVTLLQNNSESKLSLLLKIQIIGFILFVFIGWLFYTVITRSLVKPVEVMVDTFEKISEGDLTVEVNHLKDDEIGKLAQCINKVVNNLAEIIRLVKASSYEVGLSTDEIASGSDDLASRTNEEAASITQTSATLEELTSIVKQNRTNSEEIGTSIVAFNREIHSKNELMTDVTDTMKEIHESGRKIDAIVNVINDISFQTNLLALNAAVEAARAGEAGRGFAVVASEVRNLAQKTAESSKTIQDIVSSNVESTEKGMDLVKQTTDFFSTILRVMQDIENRIEQITDGSKQQATGVEQINTSVNQLENVINQNAALVEELSATAKNMKTNSSELRKLVDHFQIGDSSPLPQVKPKVTSAPVTAPKAVVSSSSSKPAPSPIRDKNASTPKSEKSDKKAPVETKSSKPISPQPKKEIKATTPPPSSASQKKSAPAKEEDFFGMDDDGFEEF